MDVPAYVEFHAREFFDDLKQWLAIPSISADPACDVLVIDDATMWAADVPSMCTGMRAFGREVLFTKEGGSGPEADLAAISADLK
jgi:hypothetical protein